MPLVAVEMRVLACLRLWETKQKRTVPACVRTGCVVRFCVSRDISSVFIGIKLVTRGRLFDVSVKT